ncbi:MAG: glycosyltransferase [Verrucomicrobiae bacterium]|nr:glycosyltransferase [Verrucomicrobiae bacterium]
MGAVQPVESRVKVDGKFFRLGDKRFHIKGVAYGPLGSRGYPGPFAPPDQTTRDLKQITELGANVVRVYSPPPLWFLDLAAAHKLKVFVDIPWNKHVCFLDSVAEKSAARNAIRNAVRSCAGHPAVFAYSVVNEIPPDIVRWSGARKVERFIDELVAVAKDIDPHCLCTFANYPPTEFLQPQAPDFVCFNLFLYRREPFENYIARLQVLAGDKPLVLGEVGMDSLREGEPARCEFFNWQIEAAFRGGVAGLIVFSFTDEWVRNGRQVEDWQMGITTAARQPKDSFWVIQKQFRAAPYFPLPRTPRVSVLVASYNSAHTLRACLDSLARLNYPDYEVILVDDGSTDGTPDIARAYPQIKYIRHNENLGLGAARNTGIAAATGEIVAFTDADCRADEDWLYQLVGTLVQGEFAGAGGPNIPPPEDSAIATAVMASPGGPAHVLLSDREAEHVPGCNMAFYKHALLAVGGFDPVFRQAGDDVDLCWRLRQAGFKIGFSPAAVVWHHRRATIGEYLRQQYGYGRAEAILMEKHPEHFNFTGACTWRGRIYGAALTRAQLGRALIYHGRFATGMFQTLYGGFQLDPLMVCASPEYHVFVTLPLVVMSALLAWVWPLALASLALSVGVCVLAGARATIPREKLRWWSRPMVALLHFLQPLARGLGRYEGRVRTPARIIGPGVFEAVAARPLEPAPETVSYWTERNLTRYELIGAIIRELELRGWPYRTDSGWSNYDIEIGGDRLIRLELVTVAEEHGANRRVLRCRLRPRSTFSARAIWLGLGSFIVVFLGLCAGTTRWAFVSLVLVPIYWWVLAQRRRLMQRVGANLIDAVAEKLGVTKLDKI